MNLRLPTASQPPPRRAAWLLLLVFLFGHTPLLPALSGLAAWIDGSHTATFTFARHGVKLTLEHDGQDLLAGHHRHSGWLTVLTAFTHNNGSGHSDHVISFATGGITDVTRDGIPQVAGACLEPTRPVIAMLIPPAFEKHGSREPAASSAEAVPEPPLPARLRTVQLVI